MINGLKELSEAVGEISGIESKLIEHTEWESSVKLSKNNYQKKVESYKLETDRRRNTALATNIAALFSDKLEIKLPEKPEEPPLSKEPCSPTAELARYKQIASEIWDYSLRHPLGIRITITPKAEYDKYIRKETFKSFSLNVDYEPYFNLLRLTEQAFNEAVRERRLGKILKTHISDLKTELGQIFETHISDLKTEDRLQKYLVNIKDSFEAKGFLDYVIFLNEKRITIIDSTPDTIIDNMPDDG